MLHFSGSMVSIQKYFMNGVCLILLTIHMEHFHIINGCLLPSVEVICSIFIHGMYARASMNISMGGGTTGSRGSRSNCQIWAKLCLNFKVTAMTCSNRRQCISLNFIFIISAWIMCGTRSRFLTSVWCSTKVPQVSQACLPPGQRKGLRICILNQVHASVVCVTCLIVVAFRGKLYVCITYGRFRKICQSRAT